MPNKALTQQLDHCQWLSGCDWLIALHRGVRLNNLRQSVVEEGSCIAMR